MLVKLAIWYLRRKKVSAIINMKVTGGTIQQKTDRGATYDSELTNTEYLLSDGQDFNIPKGKFRVEIH